MSKAAFNMPMFKLKKKWIKYQKNKWQKFDYYILFYNSCFHFIINFWLKKKKKKKFFNLPFIILFINFSINTQWKKPFSSFYFFFFFFLFFIIIFSFLLLLLFLVLKRLKSFETIPIYFIIIIIHLCVVLK